MIIGQNKMLILIFRQHDTNLLSSEELRNQYLKSSFAKTDNQKSCFFLFFLIVHSNNLNQSAVGIFWLSKNNKKN